MSKYSFSDTHELDNQFYDLPRNLFLGICLVANAGKLIKEEKEYRDWYDSLDYGERIDEDRKRINRAMSGTAANGPSLFDILFRNKKK